MRRTCHRIHERTGKYETEVTYGLTSLPATLAGPPQLEQIWRSHWTIENCFHHVRDEMFGEDRRQVHSGAAPQVLTDIPRIVGPHCAFTVGAISQPPPAATQPIRNAPYNYRAHPNYEITLITPTDSL